MPTRVKIPVYVSWVAALAGLVDPRRGYAHTYDLEHAASKLAGLDMTAPNITDSLILMGAFGISNFLTGIMLILLAWKMRAFALAMMAIIPLVYGVGGPGLRQSLQGFPESSAVWTGLQVMTIYLTVCIATFISGVGITLLRYRKSREPLTADAGQQLA